MPRHIILWAASLCCCISLMLHRQRDPFFIELAGSSCLNHDSMSWLNRSRCSFSFVAVPEMGLPSLMKILLRPCRSYCRHMNLSKTWATMDPIGGQQPIKNSFIAPHPSLAFLRIIPIACQPFRFPGFSLHGQTRTPEMALRRHTVSSDKISPL